MLYAMAADVDLPPFALPPPDGGAPHAPEHPSPLPMPLGGAPLDASRQMALGDLPESNPNPNPDPNPNPNPNPYPYPNPNPSPNQVLTATRAIRQEAESAAVAAVRRQAEREVALPIESTTLV